MLILLVEVDGIEQGNGASFWSRRRNVQDNVDGFVARAHGLDEPEIFELLQLAIDRALVDVQYLRHLLCAHPSLSGFGVGATLEDAVHGNSASANFGCVAIDESVFYDEEVGSSPTAYYFSRLHRWLIVSCEK